jgi:hypothetical protein
MKLLRVTNIVFETSQNGPNSMRCGELYLTLNVKFDTHFSQKKYEFFERLIIDLDLDEAEISKEAHRTGRTHAE